MNYQHRITVRLITRIRGEDGSMRRYGRSTFQHVASLHDAQELCHALRNTGTPDVNREAEVCITIYTHFMGALTLPLNEMRQIGEEILETEAKIQEDNRKVKAIKAV